jgi:tetratricopeptide (TPR) repeat protein
MFFAQHSQDAVNAFEEDLKISEEIGDLVGQLKMPGLIAGCHRRSKNYEVAIEHYENAANKARAHESTLDLAFALSGLAFCAHQLGRNEQSDEAGTELAKIVSQMESNTLSHLKFELNWLSDSGLETDWAKQIKLLKEPL